MNIFVDDDYAKKFDDTQRAATLTGLFADTFRQADKVKRDNRSEDDDAKQA